MVLFLLFGGFFANVSSIPKYYYPFKYVSFFKVRWVRVLFWLPSLFCDWPQYAYQIMVRNEFEGITFNCDGAVSACHVPSSTAHFCAV